MTTEFEQLALHPQLVQRVTDLGYEEPTPIQAKIIPLMLAGHDVTGQAQTGTGKTAAFALPILHRLEPGAGPVQALIVAPTRELALQVAHATYQYGQERGARVLAIYGGQPYGRQISRLKKGVDIVVGTPGRLLDLIKQKSLDLSQVRTVVLDEADEMLSMGFIEDIEAILEQTPDSRQTALFSATLPPPIRRLAEQYLRDPQAVTIQRTQMTVAAIDQRYYSVNEADKLAALTRLFEVEPISSALIFARTRVGTGELANELSNRGFPAEALNGDLSQEAREQVLNRFRRGQIKVLVATDVAARGLDIDDISHVFNYDLPQDPEVYVHRIGRTGRAGKSGVAISLMTPRERYLLQRIERFARNRIGEATLPSVSEIQDHREKALLERMDMWLRRGRCSREREMVTELVAEGHDLLEVAAVALKMARAEEKQRPIPEIRPAKERPARSAGGRRRDASPQAPRQRSRRSHEKGMVRLTMNAGRAQGVRPNDVVGTIAFHAQIPGSTIGAIHIQPEHTLIDVPQQLVSQVLDESRQYQIHRQPVTLEMA